MKLVSFLTTLCTLLTFAIAAKEAHLKNSTQEYYLKTKVKPNQPGKQRFDGLWLEAYHTGAGLDDAVMVKDKNHAIKGFLNGTDGGVQGTTYRNQVFDLGTSFPWVMVMEESANFYAAWEPVRVNVGSGASDPKGLSGFWINSTGLQWTTALHKPPTYKNSIFGGWLVCDWWHGEPQLFFRISYYDDPAPCSCADVWLCPEYI